MGEKLWTREFIGMGLTNFFYFMSQYIMIAALPVYIMDDLGLGEWEAGMAMTCFQIGTVVSRPLAGRVIDAVNKQRLLLIVSVLLFLLMTGFFSRIVWRSRFRCDSFTGSSSHWGRRLRQRWRRSCFLAGGRERGSATLRSVEIWRWSWGPWWGSSSSSVSARRCCFSSFL